MLDITAQTDPSNLSDAIALDTLVLTPEIEGVVDCAADGAQVGALSLLPFRLSHANAFSRAVSGNVEIACSELVMDEVAALRYAGFSNRGYGAADPVTCRFREPVDQFSLNFLVRNDLRASAVVRMTRASEVSVDPQLSRLIAENSGFINTNLDRVVICSRFVRDPRLVSIGAVINLFRSVYWAGLLANAAGCLLETKKENVPMFVKFGFQETGVVIEDRDAGNLVSMHLDPFDINHLKEVGSPYLKVARTCGFA